MKTPTSPQKLTPTIKTTTVFVSGNSQAVRLPKEFRFNTDTVEISRRGDEIVLRERPHTLADALAHLPAPTKEEAAELDHIINQVKADPLALEERDFSWMDESSAKPTARKSKAAGPSTTKPKTKKRA